MPASSTLYSGTMRTMSSASPPFRNRWCSTKMFLQQAGIAPEDAYAIGDGYNDITMMKVVGHSIAMGNAVDELKEVADYVTADILDDGLYKAFEHYDLL